MTPLFAILMWLAAVAPLQTAGNPPAGASPPPASITRPEPTLQSGAPQSLYGSTVTEMIDRAGGDLEKVTSDVDAINRLLGISPQHASKPELYKSLFDKAARFDEAIGRGPPTGTSRLDIFHGYVPIFVVSFIISLIATPVMRRLALANGIIDRPSETRKAHRIPVAYLGGVAIFLAVAGGILYSYLATVFPGLMAYHSTSYLDENSMVPAVPISVLLGMTAIMLVGLLDDVVGIRPHVKVGGQLVAAAALAASDVGVKVAAGVLAPIGSLLFHNPTLSFQFHLPFEVPLMGSLIHVDLIYWAGTAVIAVFVLGACNASNLIDGLDGLLSGVTAIANAGLLMIALMLAVNDDGPLDATRIILCLAVMGACLGFLPHNFNPATIFLGDCGSMLLGFCTIVIILTLGDQGRTHLVLAGLIIYAIPIIDTILAIIRRRMAGKSISDADDQHLHHMLKRSLGVKGAVFTLYALGAGFAILGVEMVSFARARSIFALTLVFAAFIVVMAVKAARRKILEEEALLHSTPRGRPGRSEGAQPSPAAEKELLGAGARKD